MGGVRAVAFAFVSTLALIAGASTTQGLATNVSIPHDGLCNSDLQFGIDADRSGPFSNPGVALGELYLTGGQNIFGFGGGHILDVKGVTFNDADNTLQRSVDPHGVARFFATQRRRALQISTTTACDTDGTREWIATIVKLKNRSPDVSLGVRFQVGDKYDSPVKMITTESGDTTLTSADSYFVAHMDGWFFLRAIGSRPGRIDFFGQGGGPPNPNFTQYWTTTLGPSSSKSYVVYTELFVDQASALAAAPSFSNHSTLGNAGLRDFWAPRRVRMHNYPPGVF